MPANIITINGVSEFYVGDSKMPQFLRWLKENGFPYNKEATEILKYAGRLPPRFSALPNALDSYGGVNSCIAL